MRNCILTISHSTKILKHPVDNVKHKNYFFTRFPTSARKPEVPVQRSIPLLPAGGRLWLTATVPCPKKTDSTRLSNPCFTPFVIFYQTLSKYRQIIRFKPSTENFFVFPKPNRRTNRLAELAKIAGNGNFPFPRPYPSSSGSFLLSVTLGPIPAKPFPPNLSTPSLFPAFPFPSSFSVPFPETYPQPAQSLSPSSSPLPLSQTRDIFIFFLLLLFFFFFLLFCWLLKNV